MPDNKGFLKTGVNTENTSEGSSKGKEHMAYMCTVACVQPTSTLDSSRLPALLCFHQGIPSETFALQYLIQLLLVS